MVHLLGLNRAFTAVKSYFIVVIRRKRCFKPDLFRYNYLLDEIESETNSVTQKLEWIKKGFVTYMQDYYYEAKVRLTYLVSIPDLEPLNE